MTLSSLQQSAQWREINTSSASFSPQSKGCTASGWKGWLDKYSDSATFINSECHLILHLISLKKVPVKYYRNNSSLILVPYQRRHLAICAPMPHKTPTFITACPHMDVPLASGTNTKERSVASQLSSGQHFSTFFLFVLSIKCSWTLYWFLNYPPQGCVHSTLSSRCVDTLLCTVEKCSGSDPLTSPFNIDFAKSLI